MISEFQGKYRWLSNFISNSVGYNVEIEYQASKAISSTDRNMILNCGSAATAKRLAKSIPIRPDWETVKDDVMLSCVRKKFSDPVFAQYLLDTGDSELIEGNWWGDRYWGVCGGSGLNKLGLILMKVRQELRGLSNE